MMIWVEARPDQPLPQWWEEFCQLQKLSNSLSTEKLDGDQLTLAQLLDAAHSFNLFTKKKIVLVRNAERFLKKEKGFKNSYEKLENAPHPIVLVGDATPPKDWMFASWKAPSIEAQVDEQAIFKWIDAIDTENLKSALEYLELSLKQDSHPLVFLQLVTRHFRMGRLIQHAYEKRLSENEMLQYLKIPRFVLLKWKRKKPLNKRQWAAIFDRLHRCDLELKSGGDNFWCLRKLTYDLALKLVHQTKTLKRAEPRRPASLFEQSLWKVAPSFF